MMTIFLRTGIMVLFIFAANICFATEYLDQRTAPGTVPPVYQQGDGSQTSPADIYRNMNPQDQGIQVETIPIAPASSSLTEQLNAFSAIYKKKGRPRMAIFMNRYLSDEVKEWTSNSRFVATGNGSYKRVDSPSVNVGNIYCNSPPPPSGGGVDIQVQNGSLVLTQQRKVGLGGERQAVMETNLWQIESGFLSPLLEAGVNIVDRATILRLVSAGQDTNSLVDVKEKTIEISALKKYSEIFIELLINKSGATYEFKAVAKEIKTGRIIGMVTTLDGAAQSSSAREPVQYAATSSGFQPVQAAPRTLHEISSELGLRLMSAIQRGWSI